MVIPALLATLVALPGCASGPGQSTPTNQNSDLSSLSDEFDKANSMSNWQRIEKVEGWNNNQFQVFDIGTTKPGFMTMMPYSSSWYRDLRGILVFKNVSGNFVVTTKLAVANRQGTGAPRSQYSLAGIMVRAPRDITPSTWRPGGENYVFLSMGAADQPGQFQLEVKTTINSDSQLAISNEGQGRGLIRVARIGNSMIMLKNLDGQWQIHRRYYRNDFPETLQVGLTCYTDWPSIERLSPQQNNTSVVRGGNPDLIAQIDYVRYTRPVVPASLSGRNPSDSRSVSDAELLAFLSKD